MMSLCYTDELTQLIKAKKVDEALLDEAVERVLDLKNVLGLFEDPYRGASEEKENKVVGCEQHHKLALEAAEKSAVLLKNEAVLPLEDNAKIALIGPYANNADLLGEWSIFGKPEKTATLKAGMATIASSLSYAQGSDQYERNEALLEEAVSVAKQAEQIVLALGEGAIGVEKGGADQTSPWLQLKLS